MTTAPRHITPADFARLESKVDDIIDFFHIKETPRRPKAEIQAEVRKNLFRLQKKQKRKEKNA